MRFKNYLLLAGLLAAAIGVNLWADSVPKPGEVLGSVEYLREPQTPLSIHQVFALPDSAFRSQDPCCNTGLADQAVWFRFKHQNIFPEKKSFLIEVVNPSIESLRFFHLSSQGTLLDSFTTGAIYRFAQRPDTSSSYAENRNFVFPVTIEPDSTNWCYLRASSAYPLTLRILIFDREDRLQKQQRYVDILMTVFFALCVLFLILAAILIVSIQQPFHWYYFMYVLLTTLFIPAHLGLGFKYAWPNTPDLQFVAPMALNILRLIFGMQFFRYYFELPRTSPRFNKILNWVTGLFLLTLFILVIHRSFDSWFFVGWVFYPFFATLLLFCLLVITWLGYSIFFRRQRRFNWVYVIVVLNVLGVAITSQQYTGITWFQQLGMGWIDLDLADKVLTVCGVANTFFLSPLVIAAFFIEMVLVFSISNSRYLQLIEKGQKAQMRLAQAREASLNALIVGAENERKRIARELHDGACVNLAAINMKMDALAEQLAPGDTSLAAKAAEIAADIDATFKEVRGISHDLMSKTLEKTGLKAAIEELAMRAERTQTNVTVHFFANFPLDTVGSIAKIHVYRIIQELVGNVLKHAKASEINIQVLENDQFMLITVEDNGIGFNTKRKDFDGIGLSNIRHRVETLRGQMHLDSSYGKGTFVSIELPKKEL